MAVRLLIIEFITGGGFAGLPLPAELAHEGEIMVQALLRDAGDLVDLRVSVTRDPRLPGLPAWCDVQRVDCNPWMAWTQVIRAAERVLIVAPETDGALERLNQLVITEGRHLIGCTPTAVRLTTSKRDTAMHLLNRGVSAVPTWSRGAELPASVHGWVVKPDDGAGSENTFLLPDAKAAQAMLGAMPNAVAQPYIPGVAISLSLLCTSTGVQVLSCNRQVREIEGGHIRQTGVEVNAAAERQVEMQALAERIVEAVPGLRGYVGVDLIDTEGGSVVLEINPRLTTAYAGISASLGTNALRLMLQACADDESLVEDPFGPRDGSVIMHGDQTIR